ncbi:MAG: anaerobic ribonucleoside-triphosphate reductase [Methanosphaera sp.]|nr:anaerobic ribonucleoside-triphosphate reductase [Methanosphaera sp.]MEE1117536.1 anaerobic ribonucleoside-triphosphate reductase [Methanosphaera sp.]
MMKDPETIQDTYNLNEIHVIKNDGIKEKFSYEKLIKSCIMINIPLGLAEKIAYKVSKEAHDNITTKEIKTLIYEYLQEENTKLADKYYNNNTLRVRTGRDTIEPFDKSKIANTLIQETQTTPKLANKIANEVYKELKKLQLDYLTAPIIREMVNTKLTENGLESLRRKYTRLGMPVYNITNLIEQGNKDNANMMHNPETIHKYVADESLKQYALLNILPHHLADAHMNGTVHIHDLEFFAGRPINCLQHDLRQFIRYGLKVDGTGDHTSVAGSPNHIETLMNHSGEIMLAAQQNMSGGQSMSLWNVFVAPFAVGLPYEKIKQSVEMLIFNLNMAYAARGGQVPFTSIGLEFTVPDFLKNEPAYGPGGKVCGVYGDYEKEVRLLQKAFTEALIKGDSEGKPHLFPNTIYYLRKECLTPEFQEDIDRVHYLSAKFGTAYFINMLPKYMGQHANYMGCRTRLSDNWTGDWDTDTLRTGNLAYVTMNLPRIGYNARDENEIFDYLDDYMNIVEEVLLIRRERALKCLNDYKLLPFLTQKMGDDPYYRVDNSTLSFGFVGLNEMLMAQTGAGLEDPESNKLGHKVIQHINDRANQLKSETGLRWGVIQTPAESTAYRFATMDREKYPDQVICNGDSNASYYTNSSHVPVDTAMSLPEKIKIESDYHPLTQGGHIFHAFMGESYSDPDSLMSLTNKIARKTDIGFWAYSSALSFCVNCKTLMKGLQDTCTHCGETKNVEWYDRITGYVQQVGHSESASGGWNAGKKQELLDRKRWEQ